MSDGNTNIDLVSSIIAVVSVGVSAFALYLSSQASKAAKQAQNRGNELQEQNNGLQERMVRLEETRQKDAVIEANKADLIATLNRDGKSPKLKIINQGRTTAKNVRAFISGISIEEIGNILTDDGEHRIIGTNSGVLYPIVIERHFSPPFEFSIDWQDDSGIPGKYETTLT